MIKKSALNVWNTTSAEPDIFSKPGVAVAELGKEALLLPVKNIAKISSWAIRAMGSVLWGTMKLGGQAAMLIPLPLPLPGNSHSIADVRRNVESLKYGFAQKVNGNPRPFGELAKEWDTIDHVRNDAQARATDGSAPPTTHLAV